jgi:hypothetical protein
LKSTSVGLKDGETELCVICRMNLKRGTKKKKKKKKNLEAKIV